jgi:hypothetical protein
MKIKRFKQLNESNINQDIIEKLKEDLEKYGKVITCEEKGNKFHVKLKTTFCGSCADNANLINIIDSAVGKKYPRLDKFDADLKNFTLILKSK